jgi:formylglycine-generating enzyme required for sulfatase activity
MTRDSDTPAVSPVSPGSTGVGLTVLALLVAGVAAWLFAQRPMVAERPSPPIPSTAPAELSGFRSSAWFLPDDPLLGFVHIPSGPFLMGNDQRTDTMAFENERWTAGQAQGAVDLPAFYIGRYEVTVAQFRTFVRETGFEVDPQALQDPANHPVSSVSWPDALAYCRWLDGVLRQSSETPADLSRLLDAGWRVTLPTEAQWEKAARGADGRRYPWGDAVALNRANYGGSGTVPVGSYTCPECPFALSDMSGNVWEWTRSPYQPYPFTESDDTDALGDDALWVMRGGSFTDAEQNVRTAVRGGGDPGARRPFMGFRLVIAAPH